MGARFGSTSVVADDPRAIDFTRWQTRSSRANRFACAVRDDPSSLPRRTISLRWDYPRRLDRRHLHGHRLHSPEGCHDGDEVATRAETIAAGPDIFWLKRISRASPVGMTLPSDAMVESSPTSPFGHSMAVDLCGRSDRIGKRTAVLPWEGWVGWSWPIPNIQATSFWVASLLARNYARRTLGGCTTARRRGIDSGRSPIDAIFKTSPSVSGSSRFGKPRPTLALAISLSRHLITFDRSTRADAGTGREARRDRSSPVLRGRRPS